MSTGAVTTWLLFGRSETAQSTVSAGASTVAAPNPPSLSSAVFARFEDGAQFRWSTLKSTNSRTPREWPLFGFFTSWS